VSSSWALTTFSAEKPKIKKKNGKQTKVFSKIDTVETFEEGIEGTVSMMSASIKLSFFSEHRARPVGKNLSAII
tara:strand:+ start:132 stop:353 length:222 start_codon:yes stop_codon:yes gene_type:complete